MKKFLGRKKKTLRGFSYIEFRDIYNNLCSIQQSSLADKGALWLGRDNRMHIDKNLAQRIVNTLSRWIETGRL